MNNELIADVKEKKEFSGLPDSVIARVMSGVDVSLDDKSRVKETRSRLRKFFGVFLTNKVLRGDSEEILKSHISSKFRDYDEFYKKIFEGVDGVKSVFDLGCGVNGFSFPYLMDTFEDVKYVGAEATGQLVDKMNVYFDSKGYSGEAFCIDLFDSEAVYSFLKPLASPRVVLMLQVIDALESMEKDYSKRFLDGLMSKLTGEDMVIITMPMSSISGRKKFEVGRKWLRDYLEENYNLVDEFIVGNERVFRVRVK